ncbi:Swi5-domain-containing protein [Triangularia verruculosa]|uniref:Swi5-domain-containing protein n=1 Tax=Triangularia verruculosa TaxID=2587418 RepID=A0AAN6XF04_9PEZI|nr:Swi5-domain-containing protein [Triangularia verruculosa]
MQSNSDDVKDENAELLKTFIQNELTNIDLFDNWLQWQLDEGNDTHGVASIVKAALTRFKQLLGSLSLDMIDVDARSWTMHVDAGAESHDLEVTVILPGPEEDRIEITAKDKSELDFLIGDDYLGYMTKIWRALTQSLDKLIAYAQRCKELKAEEAELSHPAETTVQKHIDLLKEYNDMKDIGQQLIGLIAENQGVQIGKLYENGDYGVTVDD